MIFNENDSIQVTPSVAPPVSQPAPWRILIVDDDQDVHDVTVLALKKLVILGRPLVFYHAYSGKETVELLRSVDDIALIFLDAVMETEDAGLGAVRIIREELGLEDVRIILRTGQPGQIPELETISRYDINDYRTKGELTRMKLVTVLTAALRSWQQIRRIQNSRRGLEKIVEASNQFIMAGGLRTFAEGVISQMAGLFGLEPEGIVCASVGAEDACDDESHQGCRVIAAAGRYGHLINQDVGSLDDKRIRDSIKSVVETERSIINNDSLTVFFREQSGRRYATWIDSSKPLPDIDQHLLEVFCTNISLSASNVELVDRLKNLAWEDQLLHIPNLTAMLEGISSILESDSDVREGLAILDIDGFGQFNDVFGQEYGNEILFAVVGRLKQMFDGQGVIYRVGPDVFGVIADIGSFESELHSLIAPMDIDTADGHRGVSLSVGIAEIDPAEGGASTQLRNAFIALKKAKNEGVGRIVRYSSDIGALSREHLQLLSRLKNALGDRRLFLEFQPQVKLNDGSVCGFEALARWQDSDGLSIPPKRFIPLAESSGLIIPLGLWVMTESLRRLKALLDSGWTDLGVAVNVSSIQLRHPGFLASIDEALAETGVPADKLEIEITESISISGIDDIQRLLKSIHDRGISLAVDDFGTGYSSLSSLDRWPINRIKIDRSFVSRICEDRYAARLVDLVVPLGRRLDLRILAEGVETSEQWNRLRDLGCDDAQGYFLSEPMAPERMEPWLKEYRPPGEEGTREK